MTDWEPDLNAVIWATALLSKVRDGGYWVSEGDQTTYQISHSEMTVTLLESPISEYHRDLFEKTKVLFEGYLGYTVRDGRVGLN